jgi:predicted mannosyl-3-phosphoglycerate phosphatase (HAD superfamily)
MPISPRPAIVFCDADHLFSAQRPPASRLAASLAALTDERVTLVFCSYRTRAEVEGIRRETGIFDPFISENGAAAFVPEGYFGVDLPSSRRVAGYDAVEFAKPYDQIVEVVSRTAIRARADIVGFSDMSVEDVARECGLTLLQARLAKLREYDEPFRLTEGDLHVERRLLRALEAAGLTCTLRGRYHFAGASPGPGAAIALLTELYRSRFGALFTIAAGGETMRRRVDVSVAVPVGDQPDSWLDAIVRTVHDVRSRDADGFAHAR